MYPKNSASGPICLGTLIVQHTISDHGENNHLRHRQVYEDYSISARFTNTD